MDFSYAQRPVTYPDGARAEAYIARIPADSLRFTTVTQTDPRTRLRDAAHLRRYQAMVRGDPDPVIVAWACLDPDRPVADVFPGANAITFEGEHILSANSWITAVLRRLFAERALRFEAGAWQIVMDKTGSGWREHAEQVISWLARENRLWIDTGPDHARPDAVNLDRFDAMRNLLPIGRCGFVRDYAASERPRAAFNAAYFLLEHDDYLSHHSALGEAHGLGVEAGTIIRPPLYRRAAIWHTPEHGWQAGPLGINDITITLPGGLTLDPPPSHRHNGKTFHLNASGEQDIVLYTRSWGVADQNRVLGYTPNRADRLEITVVDTRITGWKRGGGLLIPQNGFVLSFAAGTLSPEHIQAIQRFGHVTYGFAHPDHRTIDRAIQCGPQLIRAGQIALHASSLSEEDFWVSRVIDGERVIGVVPSDYPDDVDRTRAGRIGLGVDRDGDLVVVAVPGINKELAQTTTGGSVGATLTELARALLDAGAVEAINLDGGGSTQLFVDGGLFARQGDRRGYDGVIFDRMVPSVGVAEAVD